MVGLTQARLESLAARLGDVLLMRGMRLALAESCTGGWAAQAVTALAGSSAWFDCGLVTYSNEAKIDLLGVQAATLAEHGAVSEATVIEMAQGALKCSRVQAAIAISGIAGPGGGSKDKPVGMVCFAWCLTGMPAQADTVCFQGDRERVRMQSVEYAFQGLLTRLAAMP